MTPPADSLCVVFDWVDRTSTPWVGRVRLVRYLTLGTTGGLGVHAALALHAPDSLVLAGLDSALVVWPGTQIRWPGLPVLLPSSPAAASFGSHGQAPPGGAWRGLASAEPVSTTFPGAPADVCVFVRVPPGTPDAIVGAALLASTFGSATANGGGVVQANVAFEPVAKLLRADRGGGGSDQPRIYEP